MSELDSNILKSMSVLYVEDDALVAKQTSDLLEHFFHSVIYFNNAEEALNSFSTTLVHLVITDIELPGMSGLQLCQEIRKKNRQIPMFITTIHDDKSKLQEAVKLNLVDYLIKPVSISSIQSTLIESLQRITENGLLAIPINDKTSYNPLHGQIEVTGKAVPIPLTQKEIMLLNLLLQNKNQTVPRESIEQLISPDKAISDSGYKSLIFRLRKKVGKESISSLSGVGIKLNIQKK